MVIVASQHTKQHRKVIKKIHATLKMNDDPKEKTEAIPELQRKTRTLTGLNRQRSTLLHLFHKLLTQSHYVLGT